MRTLPTIALASAGAAIGALAWRIARRSPAPDRPAHITQSEQAYRSAATKVLILGGGFGGLAAALAMEERVGWRNDVSILIVDKDNSSLFTPLVWTVAEGRADGVHVVVPIRDFQRGRHFHVLQAQVIGIDLDRRVVRLDVGERPYDYLVIALGSVTEFPNLPGVVEHALPFRTPGDAIGLRDRLIDAVEAAHAATSEDERRSQLTFVVCGGGDTGVELSGAIYSYLADGLLKEYPWLANKGGRAFRIVLVGRAPRLLPMGDTSESEACRRILEGEGIEVMTGTSVTGVRRNAVLTSRGEIPACTVYWTAGITAPPLLRDLPVKHAKGDALVVDGHLRLPEHPEVFLVGDAACIYDAAGQPVPPTAQAAEMEGTYVGKEIAAAIEGAPAPEPFRYRPRGHLSLLGPRVALARIGPVLVGGLPGWMIWHGYYLFRIPTWKRRAELLSSWMLSDLFGREMAQQRLPSSAPIWTSPPAPARLPGSAAAKSEAA